ncbi:MAG: single-stranded DNA-binding protein [Bacillota bacterium]
MNRVNLIGRITKKPELRYTTNGIAFTKFNLAVNDGYGDKQRTDFIGIVAWRKLAETIANHLNKGRLIGIDGKIQTGTYEDKNGKKSYTFDVVAENIYFLDKKQEEEPFKTYEYRQNQAQQTTNDYHDPYQIIGEQVENEYVQLQLDDDCDIE